MDPAYAWPAELSDFIAEADRAKIHAALLVQATPPWANGGRGDIWAPAAPADYADFVVAASRRYPSVRRWMIWGEPNREDRFQPNAENAATGPRAYAPLLDAAYSALKSENRANRVIGGMTWTSGTVKPPDFVRLMQLPNGRRPRLDWFGHNPFPFRFPRSADSVLPGGFRDISDLDTFSREVSRVYGRRVPLWLSEYTIQSDRGSAQFATFVSRTMQARYLTAGFAAADELGGAVAGLGWFSLLDQPPTPESANFGLLTHALQRKPAFAAMVRAPSERLRPVVRVPRVTSRSALRRRGLAVRVVPRQAGRVTVELRSGSAMRARVRFRGAAYRARTVRLRARSAIGRGRHTVEVRMTRSATARRSVNIR